MFSDTMSWSLTWSRCFTSARRLLPWPQKNPFSGAHGRRDGFQPEWQEPFDGVLDTPSGQVLRADIDTWMQADGEVPPVSRPEAGVVAPTPDVTCSSPNFAAISAYSVLQAP